jgi:hypothetical protein
MARHLGFPDLRLPSVSVVCLLAVLLVGCRFFDRQDFSELGLSGLADPAQPAPPLGIGAVPNPLVVPVPEPEFFWSQLVDTIDDYFDIRIERRVHVIGGVITEGRVVTHYQPAATLLEPWRWDSTPGYEKLHATTQSLRRRALVRVIPAGARYSVHVIVEKELEDVDRPAHDMPGSAIPRHDGSLMRTKKRDDDGPRTLGWIPLGRDVALENEILGELYARLFNSQQRG